eukprot:snap_masked-scaffold_16-processed-gene-0.22-mRNA-1 protein AED:1.00 eAED:1.00 QI:0/-1/0/0/-1/1/1/0/652
MSDRRITKKKNQIHNFGSFRHSITFSSNSEHKARVVIDAQTLFQSVYPGGGLGVLQLGNSFKTMTSFAEPSDDNFQLPEGKSFAAYISCNPSEAGRSPRSLHLSLNNALTFSSGSNVVYLGANETPELDPIQDTVLSSCCLVALLTPSYFRTASCLLELVTAYKRKIPVVKVELVEFDSEGEGNGLGDDYYAKLLESGYKLLKRRDMNQLNQNSVSIEDVQNAVTRCQNQHSFYFSNDHETTANLAHRLSEEVKSHVHSFFQIGSVVEVPTDSFLPEQQVNSESSYYASYEYNEVDNEEIDLFTNYLSEKFGKNRRRNTIADDINELYETAKVTRAQCFLIILTTGFFKSTKRLVELVHVYRNRLPIIAIKLINDSKRADEFTQFEIAKYPRKSDISKKLLSADDLNMIQRYDPTIDVEEIHKAILHLMNHRVHRLANNPYNLTILEYYITHITSAQYKNPNPNFFRAGSDLYQIYFSFPSRTRFEEIFDLKKLFDQSINTSFNLRPVFGLFNSLEECQRNIQESKCFVYVVNQRTRKDEFKYWQFMELKFALEAEIPIMYLNLRDKSTDLRDFYEDDWPTIDTTGWDVLKPGEWEFMKSRSINVNGVYEMLKELRESQGFEIEMSVEENKLKRKLVRFFASLPGFDDDDDE